MAKPTTVEGLVAGMRGSDAGVRILAARFADVRRHEPVLLRNLDVEAIHDMRVATRRLRAALKLYGSREARKDAGPAVKELQDALGDVRDGQVQLAWFETLDATAEEKEVVDRLAQAHREALREEERTLERTLKAWAESEAPRVGALLGGSDARGKYAGRREQKALRKRLRKIGKLIDAIDETVPAGDAHALRILAKKVRYQAELLAPAFPEAVTRIIDALTTLQDALGALHDLDVRRGELARLGKTLAKGQRTGVLQLMARLEEERMDTAAGIVDLFIDFRENGRMRELVDALDARA